MMLSVLPSQFRVNKKLSFATDGEVLVIGPLYDMCEALQKNDRAARIEVRFNPRVLRNYQNVFQSSDGNKGIRLEIDETGSVGAIIGARGVDFIAAGSEQRAVTGTENIARIQIRSHKGIALSVNSSKTVETSGDPAPDCNNWLIGQGFDETRKLEGTSSVKVSLGQIKDVIPAKKQVRIAGQILLFGAFLWWSLARKPQQDAISSN